MPPPCFLWKLPSHKWEKKGFSPAHLSAWLKWLPCSCSILLGFAFCREVSNLWGKEPESKAPLCHLHTTVALPRCTLKHWQGVGFIPTSTLVSPDEAGVDQARMDKWTREAGAYMPGEQLLLLRCFRKVGRRLMERGISSVEQAEDGSLRK